MKNLIWACLLIITLPSFSQSDGCNPTQAILVKPSFNPQNFLIPGSFIYTGLVEASCANGNNSPDGWFSFVATSVVTNFKIQAPSTKMSVAAYTGCGTGEIACKMIGKGITDSISFASTIGKTYYIQLQRRTNTKNEDLSGSYGLFQGPQPKPLPVELISFEGVRQNETNELKWTTATEYNNDYFTIERSFDGVNFLPISTVKANGNSTTPYNYQFSEKLGYFDIVYYRLFQTDFDGTIKLCGTVSIQNKSTEQEAFHFSPNPSSGIIHLFFTTGTKNSGYFIVKDNAGRILQITDIPPSTTYMALNLVDILPGMYYLFYENKLHDTPFDRGKKIIIQ